MNIPISFKNMWQSIMKIFALARYDIANNINTWLYICGLQTLIYTLLSFYIFLPGSFIISFPDVFLGLRPFEYILGQEYYELALNCSSFLLIFKLVAAILCDMLFYIVFPIVIIQNALDLAFDSAMRGFSIKGPILSFMITVYTFFFVRMMLVNFHDNWLEYLGLQAMDSAWATLLLLVLLFGALFIYNYMYQRLRFVGMHLFEYKLCIRKSIQASLHMTCGKMKFLSAISILQITSIFLFLVSGAVLFVIGGYIFDYISSQFLIHVMSLDMVIMMQSILTALFRFMFWVFVMVWYYLVEAHTYRQLACPAIDKPSCSSCECAS
ncbi:hypothetical protein [Candidatus Chromulinivorax destructor]|uniref:Uncharacterized protein n=1 Tax=Candidatus Chromulinivorax destructor TaxID=2066483 RepID=A0A345ZBJ3_9BACT|nr:hypothetical protein [Candidatus Chromulinivorax destructor]AXK60660.1 hypothetical protein C0J27_02785 [Candidatus Chromulinivorax destructor]